MLKELTTLDLLSGGRIVTAVAAGWMEGEFETLGAPFEQRGKLLDDWLDLAASAFAQMPGRVRYEGPLLSVDGWLAPALVRPGGPELWVAGVSKATLRRAAKTGVWHPVALPPDELRTMAADFRERRPDGRVVLRINVHFADEPQAGTDERAATRLRGRRSGSSSSSPSTSTRARTASSSTSTTTRTASKNESAASARRSRRSSAPSRTATWPE